MISSALEASGLEAKYLELEVTESIMMQQLETVLQTLKNLKGMSINLSIDDFGTGYSSLSYLQKFPIDTLKIDRSFVSNIDKPEGSAIVLRHHRHGESAQPAGDRRGRRDAKARSSFCSQPAVTVCRGICSAGRCPPTT